MRYFGAPLKRITAGLALLMLVGCSPGDDQQGFSIQRVSVAPRFKLLDVRISSSLALKQEAIEALENGVPLTLALLMELRDSHSLTLLADDSLTFEIRYLPLSQHFQLTGQNGELQRTFPRLRHALAELATMSHRFETGPLAPGDYEVRARIMLVQSALPAPMQLPALLSDNWRHDSGWTQWPLKISA